MTIASSSTAAERILRAMAPTAQELAAMKVCRDAPAAPACAHRQDDGPHCISTNFSACPTGALEVVAAYAERVLAVSVNPRRTHTAPFHARR